MTLPFRVRLACLTGLVIVLAGAGMLTLDYFLIRQSLRPSIVDVFEPSADSPGPSSESVTDHPADGTEPPPDEVHPLVGLSREVERVALREFVTQSSIALGLMSLVAGGVSWIMAGRLLQPVRLLTRTARGLSGSTLHQRIAVQGPRDELTELADTFDAMLDRLERTFESQRRFVANASHELRTPITISRTAVDVLEARAAPTPEQIRAATVKVRQAAERSEALIDGLLLLARADGELTERVPVDLAIIARSVLTELDPLLVGAGLRVGGRLEPAPVDGDPVLLERMVANLVENAGKYNAPGGWVTVSTTRAGDGRIELSVTNPGRLVEPADVDALFEPFRRGEEDRTGSSTSTGLGLSIVRSIAEAHGGSAIARVRPEGGLQVTVAIPS